MKVNSIKATSRCSCKVKDNYFTVEYTEERLIEDGDDIQAEREKLWDSVNYEVDNQIDEIYNSLK